MAHKLTITVDDRVYETLKPFIEKQIVGEFLSKALGQDSQPIPSPPFSISGMRGSLHKVDTSDVREKEDRDILT